MGADDGNDFWVGVSEERRHLAGGPVCYCSAIGGRGTGRRSGEEGEVGGRHNQVGEESGAEIDEVGGGKVVEVRVVGSGDTGIEIDREVVAVGTAGT